MTQMAAPYEVRWLRPVIDDPVNQIPELDVLRHNLSRMCRRWPWRMRWPVIRAAHGAHPTDLPAVLETDAELRTAFAVAHERWRFRQPNSLGSIRSGNSCMIAPVAWYKISLMHTPKRPDRQTAYPTATWVRERFWRSWRDCLPMTTEIAAEMVAAGRLDDGPCAAAQRSWRGATGQRADGTGGGGVHRPIHGRPACRIAESAWRCQLEAILGTQPAAITLAGLRARVKQSDRPLEIGGLNYNPFPPTLGRR